MVQLQEDTHLQVVLFSQFHFNNMVYLTFKWTIFKTAFSFGLEFVF